MYERPSLWRVAAVVVCGADNLADGYANELTDGHSVTLGTACKQISLFLADPDAEQARSTRGRGERRSYGPVQQRETSGKESGAAATSTCLAPSVPGSPNRPAHLSLSQ